MLMLVINYPSRQRDPVGTPFETSPLSVFLVENQMITVAPRPAEFVQPLLEGKVTDLTTSHPTDFILRLLWQLADQYLNCVREINTAVDKLEDRLRESVTNDEVMGLLDHQKSLTYFITAMRANALVLERLQKLPPIEWTDADRDLFEDLQIEMRQAIGMFEISENILSQMMDAFTSIVSNNLGTVVKLLTSVTILLAIPTLVASVYGMNVPLPGAQSRMAFAAILLLSIVLCAVLFVMFRRRKWI